MCVCVLGVMYVCSMLCRMVWENRVTTILVLTAGETEVPFWPGEGDSMLHHLVVGGEWQDDSLCVSTRSEVSSSAVSGLMEVTMTLHCSADGQTDEVHLLHYPHWPEQGIDQFKVQLYVCAVWSSGPLPSFRSTSNTLCCSCSLPSFTCCAFQSC